MSESIGGIKEQLGGVIEQYEGAGQDLAGVEDSAQQAHAHFQECHRLVQDALQAYQLGQTAMESARGGLSAAHDKASEGSLQAHRVLSGSVDGKDVTAAGDDFRQRLSNLRGAAELMTGMYGSDAPQLAEAVRVLGKMLVYTTRQVDSYDDAKQAGQRARDVTEAKRQSL